MGVGAKGVTKELPRRGAAAGFEADGAGAVNPNAITDESGVAITDESGVVITAE